MELGLRIRTARAAKKLSQQQLGDLVNKSRSLIGQIELTSQGNEETLHAIGKALNIDLFSDEIENTDDVSTTKKLEVQINQLKKELEVKDSEIATLKKLVASQEDIIKLLKKQ